MECLLVGGGRTAVKRHHLGRGQLVGDQLAHIAVIQPDGRRVRRHHDLIDLPAAGQCVLQVGQQPHTVILDDDPLGAAALLQILQRAVVQLRLVGERFHFDAAADAGEVKLLLALLAEDDERAVAVVLEPVVLERALHKAGLAALQKAEEQIYGDRHGKTASFTA